MRKHSKNQRCELHDTDISPRLRHLLSGFRSTGRRFATAPREPSGTAAFLRQPRARSEPLRRASPLNPGGRTRPRPPPARRRPCGRHRRPTAKAAPAEAPKSPDSRSGAAARRAPAASTHSTHSTHRPAAPAQSSESQSRPGPRPPSPARPRPEPLARGRREALWGPRDCGGRAGKAWRAELF